MRGVVWIAFGKKAQAEVVLSRTTMLKHHKYATMILDKWDLPAPKSMTVGQLAHWAKTNTDLWSPFDHTLLLDADTRVKGDLSIGFEMLRRGFEIVMVPSVPHHEGAVLWTLLEEERAKTLEEIGTWRHVMLNTGLIYFRKTEAVKNLFEQWRKEWLRFKSWDQGAFLRALRKCPVSMWLLGAPFNSRGGEVVDHLFGRAR